jgi:RNA polymerase sigma-70 factor (ECF subfamily)
MAGDLETDLMRRVRAGDRSAFEELFRRFERPLGGFLYRFTGDLGRAEDLVQETFLRVWTAAPNWTPSAKVSTWVFSIAHHLAINLAARKRDFPGPAEAVPADPRVDAVRAAVDDLPPGERAVVLLSEFQGFSQAEIADVLGVPVGTVKSRLFNAVRRLRERLG